jgi:hypothetical protein
MRSAEIPIESAMSITIWQRVSLPETATPPIPISAFLLFNVVEFKLIYSFMQN